MRGWLAAHARYTASQQLGTMKAISAGFAGEQAYSDHAEQLLQIINDQPDQSD